MATRSKNKKTELTPAQKAARDQRRAEEILRTYNNSSRALTKSINAAIRLLPIKDAKGDYDMDAVSLIISAGDVLDALADKSIYWAISLHWLYTVCVPRVRDISNPAFSPVWRQVATVFPPDRFGELARLDEDGGKLTPHGDKLLADSRYVRSDAWDYGSAWNDNGDVIKADTEGNPILDGWMGSIAKRITDLQNAYLKQCTRYNHFRAFLLGGTRDDMIVKRDAIVIHKPSHAHAYVQTPRQKSRYQIMEAFGVNFDDYTRTFNWIVDAALDDKPSRVDSFLNSLAGVIKNYIIPDHFESELQYLVHQSKGAVKAQKATYKVAEVTSWLPDDKYDDYAHYAGVYDNTLPASGINDAVIRNLHNSYNTAHHVAELVGMKTENRPFTYSMLRDFRSLMTHARGRNAISGKSIELIPQVIMRLIRTGEIAVGDWPTLLHAAFDEADADGLMGNKKFIERMSFLIAAEVKATIADENYDRNLQTIIITAKTGGIGKSYLANLLATHYDHGRKPYAAATVDKKKTPDLWQQYEYQLSALLDELGPGTISLQTWKDTFDQHKTPPLPSRNTNRTPVFVHHAFITDVFPGGVAEYVRKVLRYSEGVTEWGYLEQVKNRRTDKVEWRLKQNSEDAVHHYLSQLSQILRRLPVWIEMAPTPDGKATNLKISILAYRPSGRAMTHYDYCHTADSCFRINTIRTDKTPKDVAKRIGKKVADAIAALQAQADAIFDQDVTAWLPDHDGFIADNCRFGVRELDGRLSLVDLDSSPDLAGANDPNEADDIFG
jgi:hypothetical protein